MSDGAIVSSDLEQLECSEREIDGQIHVVVRDARVYGPQVIFGGGVVGFGVAIMLLGLAVRGLAKVLFAFGLGFAVVLVGIAGMIVNLRRHGAIAIDRRETRVRDDMQTLSEPTARVRAFGVSKALRRSVERHSVVILRVDDSVAPTYLTFASETRAEHVVRILNAALARAREGGGDRG